jgi:WD40 repeat protein
MFARVLLVFVMLSAAARAEPPRDAFGDPLPEGAKARIGTMRLARNDQAWARGALAPDGKHFVVPTDEGVERVEVKTGKTELWLTAKPDKPTREDRLVLSADGTKLMRYSADEVSIWDARAGKLLNRVFPTDDPGRPKFQARPALSADGSAFAFSMFDRDQKRDQAIVWAVGAGRRKLEVPYELNWARLELSGDGKLLAVWGEVPDRSGLAMQFWDVTNGKKLTGLTLKTGAAWPYAGPTFARDGTVALADDTGKVRLIDPRTGREVRKLSPKAVPLSSVQFAPDSKAVLFATNGDEGVLWDVETDQRIFAAKLPRERVNNPHGAVFVGNRSVAYWCSSTRLYVTDLQSGKPLSVDGVPNLIYLSLTFTPDGKEVLAPTGVQTEWAVARYDATTGKPLGTRTFAVEGEKRFASHYLTLYSSTKLKVMGRDGSDYLFEPHTGKFLAKGARKPGASDATLTEDGELELVRLGERNKPSKFAVGKPGAAKPLCEIELLSAFELKAALNPKGTRLVTLADRATLTVWELPSGKKVSETKIGNFMGKLIPISETAVITDDDTGDAPPVVRDIATGKILCTFDTRLNAHTPGGAISPDKRLIAFGGFQSGVPEVWVFDTSSGKLLKAFCGHAGYPHLFAFSPDGRTLASAAQDQTVLLWDVSGLLPAK